MDLGVMAMKRYSTFFKAQRLAIRCSLASYPGHLLWGEILPLCWGIVRWKSEDAMEGDGNGLQTKCGLFGTSSSNILESFFILHLHRHLSPHRPATKIEKYSLIRIHRTTHFYICLMCLTSSSQTPQPLKWVMTSVGPG